MQKSDNTVISVPASLLPQASIPGALIEIDTLRAMAIPDELKRAIELLGLICKPTLCIVRPEIYTHGMARAWLNQRLGNARHHVGISDGTSVKIIDGLENHCFFYARAEKRGVAGLQNLLSWAPEVFTAVRSQINSFYGVILKGRLVQPATTLLLPPAPVAAAMPTFFEFLLSRHSAEGSARFMLDRGAVPAPAFSAYREVLYVPLTENNVQQPEFAKLVAMTIAAAYFDAELCVLIRLPRAHDPSGSLLDQIIMAFRALLATAVVMPRVAAKNVLIVDRDLPESMFDTQSAGVALSLLIDESFDIWRYTRNFYARFTSVRFSFGGDRRQLPRVVQKLTEVFQCDSLVTDGLPAVPPFLLNWRQTNAPSQGQA